MNSINRISPLVYGTSPAAALSRAYVAQVHSLEDLLVEYKDTEAAGWNIDMTRDRALIRASALRRIRKIRAARMALFAARLEMV